MLMKICHSEVLNIFFRKISKTLGHGMQELGVIYKKITPGVDFINPFTLYPSSYTLRRTFTPKKASQKFSAERKSLA